MLKNILTFISFLTLGTLLATQEARLDALKKQTDSQQTLLETHNKIFMVHSSYIEKIYEAVIRLSKTVNGRRT